MRRATFTLTDFLSNLLRLYDTRRNGEDRLAFFVHAFMLAEGYKLVAVGQAAEDLESTRSLSTGLSMYWRRPTRLKFLFLAKPRQGAIWKLVFAHQAVLFSGAEIDSESREVGLEGWTALAGSYAFAYTDAAGLRLASLRSGLDSV